jgi:hypothetical protein
VIWESRAREKSAKVVLVAAFEDTLSALGLVDRKDPAVSPDEFSTWRGMGSAIRRGCGIVLCNRSAIAVPADTSRERLPPSIFAPRKLTL